MSNHTPLKPDDDVLTEILRRWFIYPELGRVVRKEFPRDVGYVGPWGYVYLGINRKGRTHKLIRRTHLVWWAFHGEWPKQLIDHEDRNRTNDKIINLKLSSPLLNAQNTSRSKTRIAPKNFVDLTIDSIL